MSDLNRINELYQALAEAETRLQDAQAAAEAAQRDYNRLAVDLGDTLAACGMTELKMQDGRELGLKTIYFGSAAQERMPQIREFLAIRGSEGMVKPKKITLGDLDPASLPPELADKVEYEINTNTLKAFLAELHKQGELTPEVQDLFKVHMEYKVILK
jgi:hypothetical protein